MTTRRVKGLRVWRGQHNRPTFENLWDALGHAVPSRFPPTAILSELKTALQVECQLLNSAMVDHLIESIVTRYKLCIQVRGAHIPY